MYKPLVKLKDELQLNSLLGLLLTIWSRSQGYTIIVSLFKYYISI